VLELLHARGDRTAHDYETWVGLDATLTNLDARLRFMDELGADYRQVLLIGDVLVNPYAPPEVARDLARIGNEELTGLVAGHPDRFVGWVAVTALQDGELALAAIEEAIGAGALGALVFTATQGHCLDYPDYEQFFELMARLDRPIWIHPNRNWSDFPLTEPEPRYELYSMIGWPSDTAVTVTRLVYAGYLERWPGLKIILHHSGGVVPMLAGRLKSMEEGPAPETEQVAARLKHEPIEYLKRFYADTANNGNPIALKAALEFFGPEHVLFGTDFGYSPRFSLETLEDVETITDETLKRAVYESNGRRVLGLDDVAQLR
jgi:aminocarboxymuconate-semialdehyde decarboxylase